MKPFTSIERLAHPIGLDIGRSNSSVQAQLLTGLVGGLTEGSYQERDLDMQCAYIAQDLDQRTQALIVRLARFCDDPRAEQ